MEYNQTAVEWLYTLSKHKTLDIFDLNKAKAMERDQIEQAHEDAFIRMNMAFRAAHRAEAYYDEVYGAHN